MGENSTGLLQSTLDLLMSDRFWRSHFHVDPNVVGRHVVLDGREQTILGVLPAHFAFPDFSVEPEVYGLADLDPDTSLAVDKPVYGMWLCSLATGSNPSAGADRSSDVLSRSRVELPSGVCAVVDKTPHGSGVSAAPPGR
jgi:hypothetical protein